MNVWRRGSLTQNPYVRTAFRVTRVSRETVRRATVLQRIGQTKHIVETSADAHRIAGVPVSLADVIAAEQILLDPALRIQEELLHHAAEKPALEAVQRLERNAAEAMRQLTGEGNHETAIRGLEPWVRHLAQQALPERSTGDAPLGALELHVVPPFGPGRPENG